MSLREFPPMTPEDVRLMNPLKLAHIGDTVWDLMIRSRLLAAGKTVHHMHEGAVAFVNARSQAAALRGMMDHLSPEEQDIVRRGRNTHAHHAAPKNQDPADYASATALEALMGYLYLTGQDERIRQLFAACVEENNA